MIGAPEGLVCYNCRKRMVNPGSEHDIVELYRQAYARHGDCPAAVLWPRGRQSIRFDALTGHFAKAGFSVLDFGCGLGHLKDYLDQRHSSYEYRAVDIVPEFVEAVRLKHPGARVQLVTLPEECITAVDHVVVSGAFNIIDGGDESAYVQSVFAALGHLFALARVSLAVNFMTDRVDFRQPGALHMRVERVAEFVRTKLSCRLRVDESYMPYEFTVIAFKDSQIVRPDNIYRPM